MVRIAASNVFARPVAHPLVSATRRWISLPIHRFVGLRRPAAGSGSRARAATPFSELDREEFSKLLPSSTIPQRRESRRPPDETFVRGVRGKDATVSNSLPTRDKNRWKYSATLVKQRAKWSPKQAAQLTLRVRCAGSNLCDIQPLLQRLRNYSNVFETPVQRGLHAHRNVGLIFSRITNPLIGRPHTRDCTSCVTTNCLAVWLCACIFHAVRMSLWTQDFLLSNDPVVKRPFRPTTLSSNDPFVQHLLPHTTLLSNGPWVNDPLDNDAARARP